VTYPAGTGVFTGNSGPVVPNLGSVGAAPPFPSPGAAANVAPPTYPISDPATYNFNNGIMSTQESINGANGQVLPQQGIPAVTNVSAVALAGYPPTGFGSCSFVQVNGAWASK